MDVRILSADDLERLERVADGVFDGPVNTTLAAAFLADPRHHICVAIQADEVVGFASGVTYLHPDKPLEMWINEVGVGDAWRGRGVGRAVIDRLLQHGRDLGCREAWVLTDEENAAARGLYRAAGGEEQGPQLYITFPL